MDQFRDCLCTSSLCLLRGDVRKKNNQIVFPFAEWGCDELEGRNSQTWWGHACELVYRLPPHRALTHVRLPSVIGQELPCRGDVIIV